MCTSSVTKSPLSEIRRTLKPSFLDDFGAWQSMPSADFARGPSAESAENAGLRAGLDRSLSPKRTGVRRALGAAVEKVH